LPQTQAQLAIRGHSLEARIYAEDADRGFLPSIGRIAHLRTPSESGEVRIDTGVRAGDEISQYYDPMIAKLIVWGEDRAAALRRLAGALADYQVVGVTTNIGFLQRVIAHEAFAKAHLDTGLIARHQAALFPPPGAPSPRVLAAAALSELTRLRDAATRQAAASTDRFSSWHRIDTWWLNTDDHAITLTFSANNISYPIRLRAIDGKVVLDVAGRAAPVDVTATDNDLHLTLEDEHVVATVVPLGEDRYVFCGGMMHRLHIVDPLAHAGEEEHHGGHLAAPMSGTIIAVMVKPGDQVVRGAPLLILEAMKMEHTITAPAAGTVSAVNYGQGEQVQEGADLIDLDESPAPG